MERKIDIDGKSVMFRATAATPRHYRNLVGRDMIADMSTLVDAKSDYSMVDLEIFENVAYIMAYDAARASGESFPPSPDEWLEGFEMFSIYDILPQIIELWGANNKTLVRPKANPGGRKGR